MVGDPPYRVCIDAGHGGSDPGARGVVEEKEMTAQTSEALLALLEADPNYIPLRSRESYDVTAKPSERAEAINAQSPQLLLSIHGNSAPEGSTAAGFECYPYDIQEQQRLPKPAPMTERRRRGTSVFDFYNVSYNAGYTKYRGAKKPSFSGFGPFRRLLSLLGWLSRFFGFCTVVLFECIALYVFVSFFVLQSSGCS